MDRVQKTWEGYSFYSFAELQKELEDWQNQISHHILPNEDLEEVLYGEMIDWLDDNIAAEQDDDPDVWKYKVKAILETNGHVHLIEIVSGTVISSRTLTSGNASITKQTTVEDLQKSFSQFGVEITADDITRMPTELHKLHDQLEDFAQMELLAVIGWLNQIITFEDACNMAHCTSEVLLRINDELKPIIKGLSDYERKLANL